MTCDEYKVMFFRNPYECTNSENESHEIHLSGCTDCKKWKDDLVVEKLKTIGPGELIFKYMLGLMATIEHEIAVANDPELRSMRQKKKESK